MHADSSHRCITRWWSGVFVIHVAFAKHTDGRTASWAAQPVRRPRIWTRTSTATALVSVLCQAVDCQTASRAKSAALSELESEYGTSVLSTP